MCDSATGDNKGADTWIDRVKKSSPFVLAALIGVAIGSGLDIADKAQKVFGKSDTMVLAENSDKSRFSDNMVRTAYKRLHLADLFVRRVQDDAPSRMIEETWKDYVQSVKDWNADLMINIVGMETYYDGARSEYFEYTVQPAMIVSDTALRKVVNSPYVRAALKDATTPPSTTDKGDLDAVGVATNDVRHKLYSFIFCMESKTTERKTQCGK